MKLSSKAGMNFEASGSLEIRATAGVKVTATPWSKSRASS